MKIQVLGLAAVGLVLGLFLWGGSGGGEAPARLAQPDELQPTQPDVELKGLLSDQAGRARPGEDAVAAELGSAPFAAVEEQLDRGTSVITGQVQDLDGHGVPGVVVLAQRVRGTVKSAKSGADGEFRMVVPRGMELELQVVVAIEEDSRFGSVPPRNETEGMRRNWVQRGRVHSKGGNPPVVVVVGPGAIIAGRMLLHPEHGSMGMSVRLISEDSSSMVTATSVDEHGAFLFDGLREGDYTVEVGGPRSSLLVVSGIRGVVGEVTRDPRLDGMQLDSLLLRTQLQVLDSQGKLIESVRVCVLREDGEYMQDISRVAGDAYLPLPRGERVTLWVHAQGYRASKIEILDQELASLRLERAVQVKLRIERVRGWDRHGDFESVLHLRRAARAGEPLEFATVYVGSAFHRGREHQLSFPGPGRYELLLSTSIGQFSRELLEMRNRNRRFRGSSLIGETNLGYPLVIKASDEGRLLVAGPPPGSPEVPEQRSREGPR